MKKKHIILSAVPCFIAVGVGAYFVAPDFLRKGNQEKPEQALLLPESDSKSIQSTASVSAQQPLVRDSSHSSSPAHQEVVSLPELGEITEANALQVMSDLKQDARVWSEQKGLFYQNWAKVAPKAAIAYARKHEGSSSSALIGQSVKGWAGQDAQAAQTWILQQKEGREKVLFGKVLLSGMQDSAWSERADWVTQFSTGPSGAPMLRVFSKEWTVDEPVEAIQWAFNLSEESARQSSLKSVIQTWVDEDSEAVGDYLNQMEKGGIRDEAVSLFVGKVASFDKVSAREWAETITDPKLQDAALKQL